MDGRSKKRFSCLRGERRMRLLAEGKDLVDSN